MLEGTINFVYLIQSTGGNIWQIFLQLFDAGIQIAILFAVIWIIVKVYNSVSFKESKKVK